tara:strand:- start:5479 stop:5727 length:249 start_codon:yes stop_codon:yes gene_type:complete
MNNYVVYTGTYTKQDGTQRTMEFMRTQDLPSDRFADSQRNPNRKMQEGYEIVYDIERMGFRAFNWNTVDGEVRSQERSVNFQ